MSADTLHIDLDTSVGPWLGRTVKIVDNYLQEAFQNHGIDLSKEQMIILKKLQELDGLNQNELASLTFRDKSSLARLLIKMETKGYVRRVQCKDDKRNNKVFITVKGAKVFDDSRPVIQEVIAIMEEGLEQSDKNLVIAVLKKIQDNFKINNHQLSAEI